MGWIISTLRINWLNMTSHKSAFWTMAFLMALQNLMYFGLWTVFFSRVSSLRGWGLPEMAYIFGSGAIGAGIFFTVFGGINMLGTLIHGGYLDIFLTRPRHVLLSAMMHRMRADGIGDIISGIFMIAYYMRPSWADVPMIVLLCFMAGIVFLSFRLIMQTVCFWGIQGETGENGFIAFLVAATNPQKGFGVVGKVILLTIIPAGYVALLPVEILKSFSWKLMAVQVTGVIGILVFAVLLFEVGLKRYSSGNQFMSLR